MVGALSQGVFTEDSYYSGPTSDNSPARPVDGGRGGFQFCSCCGSPSSCLWRCEQTGVCDKEVGANCCTAYSIPPERSCLLCVCGSAQWTCSVDGPSRCEEVVHYVDSHAGCTSLGRATCPLSPSPSHSLANREAAQRAMAKALASKHARAARCGSGLGIDTRRDRLEH